MFLNDARSLLEAEGWNNVVSPYGLLDRWAAVISDMETGYGFNIYEYDNDVSIRGAIELVLESANLKRYPEYEEFRQRVVSLDENLKNLFSNEFSRDDRSVWWEAGILTRAGTEYKKDIQDLYGFKI